MNENTNSFDKFLSEQAGSLIPSADIDSISQAFEQDCRRYNRALNEQREASVI